MFDLDAFDKEVARRFRKPDDARVLCFDQIRQKKLIAATAVGVSAACVTTAAVAFTSTPAPMTSTMTYKGMTIEEFADEMQMSIYDPFVLVLFEDLCAQSEQVS